MKTHISLLVAVALGALACADADTGGQTPRGSLPDAGRTDASPPLPIADAGRDAARPQVDAAGPDAAAADAAPPRDARLADRGPPADGGPICEVVTAGAAPSARPVDIVWVIDASPSMGEEIALIEANLNRFAQRIGGAGVDHRVVLVGSDREQCGEAQCFFEICVPPPLSGAEGCPDTDSDRYLHVRAPVHSRDALDVLVSTQATWRPFLRPEARTHFVIVTDDNAGFGLDADELVDALAGLPDWVLHSVVDEVGRLPNCGLFDEPPCSCGEERGQTYIDLSQRTGGLVLSVCAADWDPLFTALEERVVGDARIPCSFRIPDFGEGIALDPERLNVTWTGPDGMEVPLANVDDAAGCARAAGWYYDDPGMPTEIRLCDALCGAREGTVVVEFGCQIRKI
ncbi:MAG: hypothetical protein R3F60_27460 [bacterium]